MLSTGVIGAALPVAKVLEGARAAASTLSPEGGSAAASAILTTDSGPKVSVTRSGSFTVGGMAKGAGMIHPRLATMLVVITTDYPLVAGEAASFLRPAVAKSFNRISVDGDCSTNDAVVLLANGASGAPRDDEAFALALDEVCRDLARQVVADGEGATVVLEISVTGAATTDEAVAIARRIATSPLVKTAAFGHDPNWGRVLAAAGSAPHGDGFARLETERLTVAFDGVAVFSNGSPTGSSPALAGAGCRIDLDLGLGDGAAAYLASDLTYDYVRINAEYTTSAASSSSSAAGWRRRRPRRRSHSIAGAGDRRRSRRRATDHGGDRATGHRPRVRRPSPRHDDRGAGCGPRLARRLNSDVSRRWASRALVSSATRSVSRANHDRITRARRPPDPVRARRSRGGSRGRSDPGGGAAAEGRSTSTLTRQRRPSPSGSAPRGSSS